MEATIKAFSGRVLVKVTGETVRELFKAVSDVEQSFNAQKACGKCQSTEIFPNVRTTRNGDNYFELRCRACNAQFVFGQHKTGGTLYPKGQWQIYQRGDTGEEYHGEY